MSGAEAAAIIRQRMLNTKSGAAGLLANGKVFGLAMFACLGGLLYGYNQGVFSGILAMHAFERHVSISEMNWWNLQRLIGPFYSLERR